jgi:hypothetical protein
MVKMATRCALIVAATLALAETSAHGQVSTRPRQGQGGSIVKGSAGINGGVGDDGLEHCDKPMGAMASLQRRVGTLKQEAAAGGATRAGAVFSEGDVLMPKIADVRLLSQPTDTGKVVATLSKGDELVVVAKK